MAPAVARYLPAQQRFFFITQVGGVDPDLLQAVFFRNQSAPTVSTNAWKPVVTRILALRVSPLLSVISALTEKSNRGLPGTVEDIVRCCLEPDLEITLGIGHQFTMRDGFAFPNRRDPAIEPGIGIPGISCYFIYQFGMINRIAGIRFGIAGNVIVSLSL
jgi:hypothetical protein